MVYCSIDEAWGDNFEPSTPDQSGNSNNVSLGQHPPQPKENLIRDETFNGSDQISDNSAMLTGYQRSSTPLSMTHNSETSRDLSLQPFVIDGEDEYQSYGGDPELFQNYQQQEAVNQQEMDTGAGNIKDTNGFVDENDNDEVPNPNLDLLIQKMERMMEKMDNNNKSQSPGNPHLDLILFLVMGGFILIILDLFFKFGQKFN